MPKHTLDRRARAAGALMHRVPDALPTLPVRVAAAKPGDRIVIDSIVTLESTLVLRVPLTLVGRPNARLQGACRDALIRIEAEVTLENLTIARTPRADGSASWGSCVVVGTGGDATLQHCTLVGAADGWLVEPSATLLEGEEWSHAGLDVRGAGHASITEGEVDACSTDRVVHVAEPGRGLRLLDLSGNCVAVIDEQGVTALSADRSLWAITADGGLAVWTR